MNRMGIFSFYDKEGIADRYVEFLLGELCHCVNTLIVVVNGNVNDEGKLSFEKYADKIYIRENTGFDAGAYKDVLINVVGWNHVQQYDELVLCNDTFYGPFVSFESIFEKMETEDSDFWGLNYYHNEIANHLQSYFLVFRKKIINEGGMIDYFNNEIKLSTTDITDVYGGFEVGLFHYLINRGYSFDVYSKNNPYNVFLYSNACIKKANLPILKKKAFSPETIIWDNIMDTLKYLDKKSSYDLSLILDNVNRIYNLGITKQEITQFNTDKANIISVKYDVAKVGDKDIKDIILTGKKIYIYGLGAFSAHISKIIYNYQGQIEGYIVSDDQYNMPRIKNGLKVRRVSEVDNLDDMVIIAAVGKKNTQEIAPFLSRFRDVIFLW